MTVCVCVCVFQHSCCGVDSYNDWKHLNTSWERKEAHGQLAPESCCKSEFSAEQNCTFNSSMLHHNVSVSNTGTS